MEISGCAGGRGLEAEVAAFLDELTAAGYAPQRLAERRSILFAFVSLR
jgi:hypothetical protein